MNDIKFSLEVFPPKDSIAIEEIYKVLGSFAKLNPDFISVTYGAGGSSQNLTADISGAITNNFKIPSVAHLTCASSTYDSIQSILRQIGARGVSRILALRGDLNNQNTLKDFTYATDLIEFINKIGGFDVYAACYPEGHNESKNFEQDIDVAKIKADLGVKRFITQLFFDNEDFYRMRDAFSQKGIAAPISAGIMPIVNVNQILKIVTLSGAKIPSRLSKAVSKFEGKPEAFYQAGLNFAIEQITDLLTNGVEGIHLYSMNKPQVAEAIYGNINSVLRGV